MIWHRRLDNHAAHRWLRHRSRSRRKFGRAPCAGFARRMSLFIEAFLVIRLGCIDIGPVTAKLFVLAIWHTCVQGDG
jgi:hypothetical protein